MTRTSGPVLALAPGTRTAPGPGANTGPRASRSRHPYRQDCSCPACVLHFQLAALGKAMAARRTCAVCGTEKPYCIPRSTGLCNDCADGGNR